MRIPTFLLRDRIILERYLGVGAYGETFSDPVTIKAHVEPTNRGIIDSLGNTVRAEANVMVRPEAGPIPIDSRITWGGVKFRVLTAGAMPDEVRPSHRELTIGRWDR